jgi:peptidoglycan/xylan/chitin deacetylase (PgdA/CDA1 family)
MRQVTAKQLLGHGLFASRLNTVLIGQSAVIVMFHRVLETDGSDGLTVDVPTFERYCRYFRRHFRVLPLRDIVAAIERGATPHRALAITFDDGYLDNFENAAPVLEQLSLPATFFVVTQWIQSDVVPWWDAARGVRYPWMTWNDVRTLAARGFEIGAHTRTHVDLGKVTSLFAEEEIRGARLELEDKLGADVQSFAYPYGGARNLTETARALVKRAGFRCCCSGFGGINGTGTDPFRLRRVPVSPRYASPDQFGFDLALGRSELGA